MVLFLKASLVALENLPGWEFQPEVFCPYSPQKAARTAQIPEGDSIKSSEIAKTVHISWAAQECKQKILTFLCPLPFMICLCNSRTLFFKEVAFDKTAFYNFFDETLGHRIGLDVPKAQSSCPRLNIFNVRHSPSSVSSSRLAILTYRQQWGK